MSEKIEECGKEEKVKYQSQKIIQMSEPKQVNKLTKNPQLSYVPFEYICWDKNMSANAIQVASSVERIKLLFREWRGELEEI